MTGFGRCGTSHRIGATSLRGAVAAVRAKAVASVDPRAANCARVPSHATVLRLAAIYNLAFGAGAVLFPSIWFELAGLAQPNYPSLWQCIGMIVGVYGVGYWIAANDPKTHWPIVLVGLLGKVFGPIGFLLAASRGELPWRFGVVILTNDLIWWWPFASILLAARRSAVK